MRCFLMIVALFVAAGVGAATSTGAGAATAAARPCWPKGSTTQAKGRRLRVFSRGPTGAKDLYACARAKGHPVIVTHPDEDWYPRPAIDVKGLTFGYAADRCDPGEGSCETVLRIFAMTAAGPAVKREIASHGDSVKIGSLGLARNGAAAWVECPKHGGDFDGNPRPDCVRPGLRVDRVYVLSSTGKDGSERLVAKGKSIDPASVNVSEGRARWTSAGRQHSVRIT